MGQMLLASTTFAELQRAVVPNVIKKSSNPLQIRLYMLSDTHLRLMGHSSYFRSPILELRVTSLS